MITVNLTHVRLLVRDYPACFDFYGEVLEIPLRLGVRDGQYAEFAAGDAFIGLYRRSDMAAVVGTSARPPAADAQDPVVLTFEVRSVDETYRLLREKGVEFVTPPTDRRDWFLRTAHFRDPDGNLLEIYENLADASAEAHDAQSG
jgi:catechol 2,3-dioxygenase-like lactoylglutathione lyase family enzyme